MSKEEAYNKATLQNLGNNPQGTRMDIIYAAMDIWAQSQSISFGEFISNNGWEYFKNIRVWESLSYRKYPEQLTSEELYTLFTQNQIKQ